MIRYHMLPRRIRPHYATTAVVLNSILDLNLLRKTRCACMSFSLAHLTDLLERAYRLSTARRLPASRDGCYFLFVANARFSFGP